MARAKNGIQEVQSVTELIDTQKQIDGMEYENFHSPEAVAADNNINEEELRISTDAFLSHQIWKPEKFKAHTKYGRVFR